MQNNITLHNKGLQYIEARKEFVYSQFLRSIRRIERSKDLERIDYAILVSDIIEVREEEELLDYIKQCLKHTK